MRSGLTISRQLRYVALLFLFVFVQAKAVDGLSGDKFVNSCKAFVQGKDKKAVVCLVYTQGFLDGIKKDSMLYEDASEFVKRAYKTRVGRRESDPKNPELYCVPENEPLEKIIAFIADRSDEASDGSARSVMLDTLVRNYPCGV